MTITQTVEIPADHRVFFDFPKEIPEGKARIELKVIPFIKKDEKPEKIHLTKQMIDDMLKDETLLSLTGILHKDMSIEEIRNIRLAKHS